MAENGGKPGKVLGQATYAGKPGPSTWIKAYGLEVQVTKGTKYWLTELPLGTSGDLLHFNVGNAKGGDQEYTSSTLTKIEEETTWTTYNEGPLNFQALGQEEREKGFLVGSEAKEEVADQTGVGREEAYEYTASATGTVNELTLRTDATANTGVTGVVLALFSNKESKPYEVLAQKNVSGEPKTSSWITATGLSVKVTSGTKYWLVELPLGEAGHGYLLHFDSHGASGTADYESKTEGLKEATKESEWVSYGEGPATFYASEEGKKMLLGLNAGTSCATGSIADLKPVAQIVRDDIQEFPTEASACLKESIGFIALFHGPYGGDGDDHEIKKIKKSTYAKEVVTWLEKGENAKASAVEIINEPYGQWYWGGGTEEHSEEKLSIALSEANQIAYAELVEEVYNKVTEKFGTKHPALIAGMARPKDSEHSAFDNWWSYLKNTKYVEGITVHYAQFSEEWPNLEELYAKFKKPIWETEVGWSTNPSKTYCESHDLPCVSEAEQATNIKNAVEWAEKYRHMAAITVYNYQGGNSPEQEDFGIEGSITEHKTSYATMKSLVEGL